MEKAHAYSQNLQMPGIFSLPGEESTSKSDEGSLVSGDLANDAKKGMSLVYILFFSRKFVMLLSTRSRVRINKTKSIRKKFPLQTNKFLDLRIPLWKMGSVLTKFCELIWISKYYGSLWNHFVIQQRVCNRLKITYYIASSINNSENSWSIGF